MSGSGSEERDAAVTAEPSERIAAPEAAGPAPVGRAGAVLRMQAAAGNRATVDWLARSGHLSARRRPRALARQTKTDIAPSPSHSIDVKTHDEGRRIVVKIDAIPVAEIHIDDPEHSEIRVDVRIEGAEAIVHLTHGGGAMIEASNSANASIGLDVQLSESDTRSSLPAGSTGPAKPTDPGAGATGRVNIQVGPPQALVLPPDEDRPPLEDGGSYVASPAPAGALSDFEEQLRDDPRLITGVILDPDTPDEIIGYSVPGTTGLLKVVDREGNLQDMDERGLTQPPIDPIDFIPSPAGVVKGGATIAGKVGLKAAGKVVAKEGAAEGWKISMAAVLRMRGVSKGLLGRAGRAASKDIPKIVRRLTVEELNHSFDRHAAQWFGRAVGRATHFDVWRNVLERAITSRRIFPWTLGASKTVAHLAKIDGKYIVVHFFEESGRLASAFVPTQKQLKQIFRLLA